MVVKGVPKKKAADKKATVKKGQKAPKTKKRESNLNSPSTTTALKQEKQVSPSAPLPEEERLNSSEKVVLPPLNGGNNDVISARDSLEDNTESPRQLADTKPLSYEQALSNNASNVDGESRNTSPSGVLNKVREMSFVKFFFIFFSF